MFDFLKKQQTETSDHEQLIGVLGSHAGVGLWDAVLHDGDPMHPKSRWWWSEEFRRMAGFDADDETGFPNIVTSWSDRIHPEDVDATFEAFGACLSDATGKTKYDTTYRLRLKDGSYRWFRAVGGVVHDENAAPTRACGALIDVHAEHNLAERSALLDSHAGVGLWDAVLHEGDAAHPKSKWTWSGEFRRLVGFAPDDLVGFPDEMTAWSDRIHPDDIDGTFEAFGACLADTTGQLGYDHPYRLKMKDGSYRWFRAIGGVTWHPDGTPARACGALIDIHDEHNLSERSTVLDANAGVGLWDAVLHEGDAAHPESQWTWSGEFRRLTGFAPDDLAGFPNEMTAWSDRIHPDDIGGTFEAFGACLADTTGQKGYDHKYRLKMKDGSYRWFRAIGGVTRHPDGTPARACGALIDIHEEHNLSERSAVLDANAGIGLWDAVLHEGDAAHPESQWTWSGEFRRLVGFDQDDVAGFPNLMTTWSDRIHPDDVDGTFEAFAECLADTTGQTGYDKVYRLKVKDGSYRWFRAIGGVTRHPDGTPARACGSLIDIDDEKRMAAEAAAAEETRADQLIEIAEKLNSSVASAAESATTNAQSVAASTEELTATVSKVLQHANDARSASTAASDDASSTYKSIAQLGQSVEKISHVVDVIDSIAMQTNLLALNASVEAARAGTAGKGFSVVASEVRNLANQTGQATGQIGTQIADLQSDTKKAVEEIKKIVAALGSFSETAEQIASAIAEQESATRAISGGTQDVVQSIDLVSTNIKTAADNILSSSRDNEVQASMDDEFRVGT